HFLGQHAFELIVGVDALTDANALQSLARLQTAFSNLTVSVFLNTYSGTLFHPKVCWFRQARGGTLITGSGNLTEGGLSRNWEAFTVTRMDVRELDDVQRQWDRWKESYRADLFAPTSEVVISRARQNVPR